MKGVARAVARLFVVIFGAYGVAAALIHLLPDARIVALGIYAGNEGALPDLESVRAAGFVDLLGRAFTLQLGLSIDRVPVLTLIGGAVRQSLPHLAVAVIILTTGYLAQVLFGRATRRSSTAARFVSTLPLYVPVMLVGAVLPLFQLTFAHWTIAGAALAVVPLAYVLTITERLCNEELRAPYTLFHAAQGATQWQIRLRVLRGSGLRVLPSLQIVAIALLTSQVFVETIANIGGLGALTVRAAKRADLNLLLGLVLLYAAVVGVIDAAARAVRSRYPL